MENEKVSIVLPTYNRAQYIRKSIDSCLGQTYSNIELIIVDDCSTDETPEIINSYEDNRIKYIRHTTNIGLPNALNTGFANSSGEYLTWTSDDNYYDTEAIKEMVYFLKTRGCSFVYCDHYWVNDENKYIHIKLPDTVALDKGNHVHGCFLYTREVMDTIGEYDPSTKLAEDYDYWIRVSKKFSMGHLSKNLYVYRVHEQSLITKRYYEAYAVSFLVRLKNDISVDKVIESFTYFIARDKIRYLKLDRSRILSKIIFSSSKIIFSKKIKKAERIFADYKIGKIDIEKAKSSLIEVINIKNPAYRKEDE